MSSKMTISPDLEYCSYSMYYYQLLLNVVVFVTSEIHLNPAAI